MKEFSSKKKSIKRNGILSIIAIVIVSISSFLFRNELHTLALLGYPLLALSCFMLNCGVFGLSPSGLVAVELSFVFDPLATAIFAGIGAGVGEATSYLAGAASNEVVSGKGKRLLGNCGEFKYAVIAFAASLVSGNLSDAVGIMAGRARRNPAIFLGAATAAKVVKFLMLIYLAHATYVIS